MSCVQPRVALVAMALGACAAGQGSGDTEGDGPKPEIVPALSDVEQISVFRSGEGGYHTYRIPAVLKTREGTLLAFAEGRVGSAADRRENDLVLRRSTDLGVSWGPMQVVAEQGVHSLNDPTVVQVTQGAHAGRVYVMMRRVSCRQPAIGAACEPVGDLPFAPLLTWSDDDGQTWAPPRDLTAEARDAEDAVGPGLGIELGEGPHAGRLVFPLWGQGLNYALFSDDGGETWTAGEPASIAATDTVGDEAQIAELGDGRLWLNARHAGGDGVFAEGWRKVAFSEDGGASWSDLADDTDLPDQQVMASVLVFSRASAGEDRDRLLFSNPARVFRSDGTLRLSYDDGETWPQKRIFVEGYFQYNALVRLDCRHVGSLYERGAITEEILFARLSLGWLTDGEDDGACGG